ncbi:MAG: hypothetical protein C0417_11060 [Chlorobiaceae bacterium]|nr:hypothetical protein [Chlorobiaceae bacterium]
MNELNIGTSGVIRPINGESKFSFSLKNLRLITLQDWPPYDPTPVGWYQAEKEMNKHWDLLSSIPIWCPYPVQAYCVGAAQAPSLVDALSRSGGVISSLLQDSIDEYLKVHVRYFLFPLAEPMYQDQAVGQLICETLPDSERGEVRAWVDALHPNELSETNRRDIKNALV